MHILLIQPKAAFKIVLRTRTNMSATIARSTCNREYSKFQPSSYTTKVTIAVGKKNYHEFLVSLDMK
jgi:hypothetical protein